MFPQGLYNINHMPIPELNMPENYSEQRFLEHADTEVKWSLWPRRCHASGRWLWLTLAYRATFVITGPGDPAIWYRWYNRKEMLVLRILK